MRVWFQNHNLSDTNHRQHKNLIHIPDIYRKNPQLQCIAFLFPKLTLKGSCLNLCTIGPDVLKKKYIVYLIVFSGILIPIPCMYRGLNIASTFY